MQIHDAHLAANTTDSRALWRAELGATVKLAWPIALTQLGQVAMMTSDLVLIGHLGEASLAAAALAQTVLFAAFVLGMGIVSAVAPLSAQTPMELTRLAAPVTVDGVPDEAAWRGVAPLPLTMYTPVFRGTPTQRTEIRVAYDDEALYAAGRFYDTSRGGIRVNSLYRDRWNGDSGRKQQRRRRYER